MVSRRQAVIAGILAVLVLAAAVALLIASGHDHRPPHRLLVGDAPSSTTSTIAPTTTTDLPATTTTAPPKRTTTTTSTTYTGPRGGIAFVGGTAQSQAIYVMDPDGGNIRHIADFETTPGTWDPNAGSGFSGVAWSPAGDLIAAGRGGKYGGGLEVMRPDGSNRRTLVFHNGLDHPSFSPDGKWLAFDQYGQQALGGYHEQQMIIGVDGKNAHPLGSGAPAGDPAWSPDGNQIVIAQSALTIVGSDGSFVRKIDGPPQTILSDPSWSPDGTWISFTATTTGSNPAYTADIYKVHPDGSGMERVTDNHDFSASAAWSRDGSRMVFSRSVQSAQGRSTPQLWVMAPDGSDGRQLTSAPNGADTPTWA
jgi:Tol biopolymer transport system component